MIMKKLFYVTVLSLVGFAFSNAQEISFVEEVIDYGEIPQNADGNRYFTFVNTGDKPLQIKNVKTSCGCTASEYPKELIAPSDTAQLKVHYATNRLNSFSKTITVFSNAVENPRKILRIKGKVLAPEGEAQAVKP